MASLMKTLGLAGAAFAAWYFLDPKKGADRRDKAAKSARDLYDNLGTELSRMGSDIATGVNDAIGKVGEMAKDMTGGSHAGGSQSSSAHAGGAQSSGTQGQGSAKAVTVE